MGQEFVVRKGLISLGNVQISGTTSISGNTSIIGDLIVTGNITSNNQGAYKSLLIGPPLSGNTLTLNNWTETVINSQIASGNTFTVALSAPVTGLVNESILIFKIGSTLPVITQPTGIIWRGTVPVLAINTNWTICYEQVNTTGSTFEIWAVAIKNA